MKMRIIILLFLSLTIISELPTYSNEPTIKSAQEKITVAVAATEPSEQPLPDKFQIPKLSIGGADKPINIGELVQLWAKLDSTPKDLHSVTYSWTVLPQKNSIVWPDSTQIIFGTGTKAQSIVVVLTASFVYTVKEGDKIVEIAQRSTTNTITVQISDSEHLDPEPTPEPNPPNPGPDLNGLSKNAFEWTSLIARTPTYTNDKIKSDAKKLADSFNKIAAATAAGIYPDIAAILKATKDNNDAVIETKNEWLPWFTKISEFLQQSYKDGTIRTIQQYNIAWKEIAKGLEASSK